MAAGQDKTGKETNGFKSRMGARGPAPRLLRLKVEDTVLTKGAPLAKGKFTWITQTGREERWIVANCGNYTVLWNFRYAFICFGPRPQQCEGAGGTNCKAFNRLCIYVSFQVIWQEEEASPPPQPPGERGASC